MATGKKMVFAITEPDAGSNSHNIATTATRDGDVYRLSGSKTYISGVDEADAMVVVTRTGTDPDTGRARLSLFVVDTDAPGLERTLIPIEIARPRSSTRCSSTTSRCPPTACSATRAKACARCSSASTPSAS